MSSAINTTVKTVLGERQNEKFFSKVRARNRLTM